MLLLTMESVRALRKADMVFTGRIAGEVVSLGTTKKRGLSTMSFVKMIKVF